MVVKTTMQVSGDVGFIVGSLENMPAANKAKSTLTDDFAPCVAVCAFAQSEH